MSDTKPHIYVAAGLILRPDGSLLLGQRPEGKPWEGWWELPGGKIEPGETVLQALARELQEELNIQVTQSTPWVEYTHEYPKNIVHLMFCRVTGWEGAPESAENQALAWVHPDQPLPVSPLLPATEPPLRWLRLPTRYLLSSIENAEGLPAFLERLDAALADGVRLVQFREPAWQLRYTQGRSEHDASVSPRQKIFDSYGDLRHAFEQVLQRCRDHGAKCLVNSIHPESWWAEADGVHLRAEDARYLLRQGSPRPAGMVGVSTHDAEEISLARKLDADFAVLGHVLDTPSHPQRAGMGWEAFAECLRGAGLPVFALGGQSSDTLADAMAHGAHGIAGIRKLHR